MSKAIDDYLDRVMRYANRRDADDAAKVRAELEDHLREKVERLTEAGEPPEDAVFQALRENGHPRVVGYALRPRFPLVDVRVHGTARGVVAIGPRAVGVVAYGGVAVGVLAVGGVSVGVVSLGGVALSLLLAWGGVGVALLGLAYAGLALGLVGIGGTGAGVFFPSGTGLALLGNDALPPWLAFLEGATRSAWFYNGLGFSLMAVLFMIMVAGAAATRREQRRVREADEPAAW